MENGLVEVTRQGAVLHLALNRPERHNALVPELVGALRAGLGIADDPGVRAVVLSARGRSFSTGGDVVEFARREPAGRAGYARTLVGDLHAVLLQMIDLDVPVVTAVHGACTGGAFGLVLAADAVVVGPDAWFAPWYVEVGFSPDGGWTALLPERIGRARSLERQLTNRPIDAATALDWGLAGRLADDPLAAALTTADVISGMVPGAVRHTKRLHWHDRDEVAARLAAETERFVEQVVTDEAGRGMDAFLRRIGAPS